jgi:farnesyl-diphosphate farnesyltransferase
MSGSTSHIDRQQLDQLLLIASRTFAINIPMLPGELRDALTLGYLLMRNADTLEDAYRWPKQRRMEELEVFYNLMLEPDLRQAERFAGRVSDQTGLDNPDHQRLLSLTPYLLEQLSRLPAGYELAVRHHVARVTRCMQAWVELHDDDNRLRLTRLKELDDYCYSVAGIVGELITTLISIYRPTLARTRLLFLRTLETACGAGLQLTNIIKDVFRDHLEGRYYIPPTYLPFENGASVEPMLPIFAYAYRNLCLGVDYACTLPEDEVEIRKSVLVPLLLALETLVLLLEQIEGLFRGADIKISREKVAEMLDLAEHIAGENEAIRRTWKALSAPLHELSAARLAPEVPMT